MWFFNTLCQTYFQIQCKLVFFREFLSYCLLGRKTFFIQFLNKCISTQYFFFFSNETFIYKYINYQNYVYIKALHIDSFMKLCNREHFPTFSSSIKSGISTHSWSLFWPSSGPVLQVTWPIQPRISWIGFWAINIPLVYYAHCMP